MLVPKERTEAVLLNVAAQSIIQEYGLDDDGQKDDMAILHRLGAVGNIGVDQQDVSGRQEQPVFMNLVGDISFLNHNDLQVTVPMAADILIQKQGKIIMGDGHGKSGCPMLTELS